MYVPVLVVASDLGSGNTSWFRRALLPRGLGHSVGPGVSLPSSSRDMPWGATPLPRPLVDTCSLSISHGPWPRVYGSSPSPTGN